MIQVSIVLPAFNEADNIEFIYSELIEKLGGYENELEIIFVDDGSKDGTFQKIKALNKKDKRVKGICFSRNFGHQSALLAGLSEAGGEYIITLDCDGQHPADIIPLMMAEADKGFDIVNTRRLSTADAGWFKNKTSSLFYRMINSLSNVEIQANSSDFRLMNKKARDAFLQLDEQARFTRGLVSWIGFRQSIISYNAPERFSGKSKYTLKKMLRFGMDGITAFSSKPLRVSFLFGLIVFIFGIIYSLYAVIMYIIGRTNPGWTSLLIIILLVGGVQLLTMGIMGEYIARIFNESKKRPHYFIQEKC